MQEVVEVNYPNFYWEGRLVASYCARHFEPGVRLISATPWEGSLGERNLYFHDQDVSFDFDQVCTRLADSVSRGIHTAQERYHVEAFFRAFEAGCIFDDTYTLPIAVDTHVGLRFSVNGFQAIAQVGVAVQELPPPEMTVMFPRTMWEMDNATATTGSMSLPDFEEHSLGTIESNDCELDLTDVITDQEVADYGWEGMLLDEDFGYDWNVGF